MSSLIMTCGDQFDCLRIAKELFPNSQIHLSTNQGGCSITFVVEDTEPKASQRILQFREPCFALDASLAAEAACTYKSYAPVTRLRGTSHLLASDGRVPATFCYEMEVIQGAPFHTIAPLGPTLSPSELNRQKNIIQGFADFVSLGWPKPGSEPPACKGKVGSKIPYKLQLLADHLPYCHQRAVALKALDELDSLSLLPAVLNHGDILPSNIMVDPETGSLKGLVDWAEAEFLPFGTCLHGLEYLLGRIPDRARRDSLIDEPPFIYYDCAAKLRHLFWFTLRSKIPALNNDRKLLKAVVLAKTIGTLLWHGFAWDNGAIDRVVNTERDVEELVYLDAFLDDTHDFASLA